MAKTRELPREINGHRLDFTSPDKVLFPKDGLTKGDLIKYYERVAPVMLPYLKDRPISMQRYPNGIDGQAFYQKEAPDYFPDWIALTAIEKEPSPRDPKKRQCQIMCQNTETLLYLANQNCITPHVWLSKARHLNRPDRLILDLDPSGDDFGWVKDGARLLRDILTELELPAFVMTTGSRGLHITLPIRAELDFDQVKPFAKTLAEKLVARAPDRFTVEVRKKEREGKVFVDWLRNEYAQTAVPPYAVRARDGAPVATPLRWEELDDPRLHAQQFTMSNLFRRLERNGDAWSNFEDHAVSIRKLVQKI